MSPFWFTTEGMPIDGTPRDRKEREPMSWGDRQGDGGDLATIADSLKMLAHNLPPTRTLAAMLAMQGILANPAISWVDMQIMGVIESVAQDHADALLARLAETEPKT